MKQYITESQLGELSTQAKKDLYKWWKKNGYELDDEGYYSMPLLSIGQMIEFLDEERENWSYYAFDIGSSYDGIPYSERVEDDLCDALFEAVKQVLEKE